MSKQKDASSSSGEIEETPEVPGQGDLSKIKKVDLSLHGDGISHWQDEPQDAEDADATVRDKDRE
jgi:hypothetical protein